MDVDESFAEYVSVRWAMLYRLAVVLVGAAAAGDLARAGLVGAYTSWRQVQQAASPDDAVKRILVNTAVSVGRKQAREGRAGAGADAGVPAGRSGGRDREELWSRVSAMPPRERAVVVLLYYEDLAEADVARTLGCSRRTVSADAFVALTTHIGLTDFTTRALRDELVLRADEAEVPPPPLDSILAQGRQDRRRRVRRTLTWSAAGAALVVLGGTLVNLVDTPGSGGPGGTRPTSSPLVLPVSLANLPDGDPPDVAYSSRRTLHLNGREVALAGRPTAIAQTPTAVFVAYPDGRIEQVDTETLAVAPVTDTATGSVVADPEGEQIAWLEAGTGPATVVVRPVGVEGAAPDLRRTFPATPSCCDNPFVVNGMTRSGELVGSLPAANQVWVWDTSDGDLTAIEGFGNGVIDRVTATEVVVHHPPFHYAVGDLEAGSFLVTFEIQARSVDFGDPRGRRVLYVDREGEAHVGERATRRRGRGPGGDVRLRLPALDSGFSGARWEDADHVLVDVLDDVVPNGALVRCDVVSGACEIAARFDGPHLGAW
jgi:DNA-directed RNA polymerase specialized sigma24 family protein